MCINCCFLCHGLWRCYNIDLINQLLPFHQYVVNERHKLNVSNCDHPIVGESRSDVGKKKESQELCFVSTNASHHRQLGM